MLHFHRCWCSCNSQAKIFVLLQFSCPRSNFVWLLRFSGEKLSFSSNLVPPVSKFKNSFRDWLCHLVVTFSGENNFRALGLIFASFSPLVVFLQCSGENSCFLQFSCPRSNVAESSSPLLMFVWLLRFSGEKLIFLQFLCPRSNL